MTTLSPICGSAPRLRVHRDIDATTIDILDDAHVAVHDDACGYSWSCEPCARTGSAFASAFTAANAALRHARSQRHARSVAAMIADASGSVPAEAEVAARDLILTMSGLHPQDGLPVWRDARGCETTGEVLGSAGADFHLAGYPVGAPVARFGDFLVVRDLDSRYSGKPQADVWTAENYAERYDGSHLPDPGDSVMFPTRAFGA